MNMSALQLEHVSYRYKKGDRAAVDDVTCSFQPGRLTAVVGPSGSGKSTLLSLLAGLDQPSEGAVYLDGEDVSTLDADRYRRERVSMIFQAFHLFPLLTTLENVCYPMELIGVPQGEAQQRGRELLASVGIEEEQHRRYPGSLSGGEQQRVAIARALSTGAKVLLADEPTGNLDTENGGRVIEILSRLAHEEDYCVVIVTHDLAIAEASDEVFQMRDGRLVQEG
jgi:ABC-type lipoprotein export system ATPase subunit